MTAASVRFDREEKAWMTVAGGGDDERVELPELDPLLVEYPLIPNGRRGPCGPS